MMKNKCFRVIFYGFSITISLLSILFFSNANTANAASDATVRLESDKSAYNVGDSLTVWVKVNVANGALGAIVANVNFDPNILQYGSVLMTEDFSETLEETTSSGVVHVVRGNSGGLKGAATVYGIKFTAKAVGNASINLDTTIGAASDGSRMILDLGTLALSINNLVTVVPTDPIVSANDNTNTNAAATPNIGTPATTAEPYKEVIVSPSKSNITLDKTVAMADGIDKICANIVVRDESGQIIKTMKPVLKGAGGVDFGKVSLAGNTWVGCMTSTSVSEKKVTVLVSGVILSENIVKFYLPAPAAEIIAPEVTQVGTKISEKLPSDTLELELKNILAKIILPGTSDDKITSKDFITITGTATPNSILLVTVHSADKVEQRTTADASGKWSVTLDKSLAPGSHRVEVAVLDSYGNQSSSKVVAKFEVEKAKSSWIVPTIGYGILCLLLLFLTTGLIKRRKRDIAPSFV